MRKKISDVGCLAVVSLCLFIVVVGGCCCGFDCSFLNFLGEAKEPTSGTGTRNWVPS